MDDQVPKVRNDCGVAAAPSDGPWCPRWKMRSETSPGPTAAARAAVTPASTPPPASRKAARVVSGRPSAPVSRTGRGTLVAQEDRARQVAGVLALQEARIVGAEEPADGDEHRHAGVADDVGRLTTLEPGVERHKHRTGPQEAERGEHPLRTVGRPHGHPVPRPDPGRNEAAGIAVDLLGQLRVGQAQVAVHQRLSVAVAECRIVDQARHGAPDEVGPWVLLIGRGAADPRPAHGESRWWSRHAGHARNRPEAPAARRAIASQTVNRSV